MLSTKTHQRTTTPAAPLVDYNTGKLEPRAMLWAFGFAAAGVVALFVPGGALMILCWPPAYGDWGAWSALGFVTGGALTLLGLVVFGWPLSELWAERRAFRVRQADAFALDQELREQGGGLVVHEEVSEFEYTAERDDHLLMVALAFTREKARNSHWRPSIGALTGEGVWIGQRKFASVNTSQARLMLTTLAEMGFIEGRERGAAGEWRFTTADDAIERFEKARRS